MVKEHVPPEFPFPVNDAEPRICANASGERAKRAESAWRTSRFARICRELARGKQFYVGASMKRRQELIGEPLQEAKGRKQRGFSIDGR